MLGFARLQLVLLMLVGVACDCGDPVPTTSPSITPTVAPPEAPVEVATTPVTRQAVESALSWLEQQVREPAGDPGNPWALAHGLLAFGKDFKTRDGRSAVEVIAAYAERIESGEPRAERYGFPVQHNGKPIEPHAYLFVKTFLEIGLAPSLALRSADGSTIDLRRLLTDMSASVTPPQTDNDWHDAAWWLSALAIDTATDATKLTALGEAALIRLEADDAVIAASDPVTGPNAFAPDAPLGAAKRNKAHIYGHPCGGLHFFQAVLRIAGRNASADFNARVGRQLQLLLARHNAERALYAEILRSHPASSLLIGGQQLKFFGHLLETLALADELGLLRQDFTLAQTVTAARKQVAADLLAVIARLETVGAYTRLGELSVQQPQLYLDLIGDGCHAIHGLRGTLAVFASP